MATYINNYGGMGSTNTSCYGVTGCKWKPRKVSAKRDFPKAFHEVAMHHTKLSEVEPPALLDVPQNISGDGHDDVSQFPKKRKVSAVKEVSKVIAGDYKENSAPVKSEEGFTNTGKFDLSNESTDIVRDNYSKDELVTSDSVSVESSSTRDMCGADYDMRPHTSTEHEDTDVVELINTEEVTHFAKRKVSAIRCFPPGCGRNAFAQSEEELENDLAELENYSSTCKTCRDDDIEEESYGEAESDNYLKDELVPFELDPLSVESSCNTEMRGSDYDMRPHTTTEHEGTDVIELINADTETQYLKRKVSAIRCFPPGCGRNTFALSEEDLEKDLTEFEEYSSTCEACRDDDIEEDSYSGAESDDYTELELHEEACRDVDIEEDSYSEAESDDFTELELHEENAEEKRQYQTDDQMMDKERDPRVQLRPCRPRVWAVRCFPPGCGPDAANLTEEDVQVALTESRKGVLTCKSCRTK